MVILDVFTKNLNITYKTTLLSKGAFLTLIFGVVSIVLPFIFAYKTKGFWMKREIFYEQPNVKFKGEYIFLATTDNVTNPLITCSTLPHYQENFEYLDTCPSIRVREIDQNYDNKAEELSLKLQVNLPKETRLTYISIVIPLDYKLSTCSLQMQAAIFFQTFLPLPISEYSVIADVKMFQSSPLICHQRTNTQYNYSVFANRKKDIDNYEINNIIREYLTRNISTTINNVYTSFIPSNKQNFKLDLTLKYPEDRMYYRPGFWQILKWAWIQYLAIFVVISWVVTKIKSYIFTRRLVLFYEDNPIRKKQ